MATVTPRLDLDSNVVELAKKAFIRLQGDNPDTVQLRDIAFSQTAMKAVERHLDSVLADLEKAGMRRQPGVEAGGRPRRIPEELWERLEKCTKEFDVSRISLLRAVLALLAAESGESTKTRVKKKTAKSKKKS